MFLLAHSNGPGAGKSTTTAGIFYLLKKRGISCELVTEYAKRKVWEESFNTLNDQLYVFAKQHHKIFDVVKKVDVIITDAPLLISLIYGKKESDTFKQLVKDKFNSYENLNFYLHRPNKYDPVGRIQTKDQAIEIDDEVLMMLENYKIPFLNVKVDDDTINIITNKIIEELVKK